MSHDAKEIDHKGHFLQCTCQVACNKQQRPTQRVICLYYLYCSLSEQQQTTVYKYTSYEFQHSFDLTSVYRPVVHMHHISLLVEATDTAPNTQA